jgi:hypothetical protein
MEQQQQDPTQLQNAMIMQALAQSMQNQQSSLGNGPLGGIAQQQALATAMPSGTPTQAGTPVGQQPSISPQAYGAMYGIPPGAYSGF